VAVDDERLRSSLPTPELRDAWRKSTERKRLHRGAFFISFGSIVSCVLVALVCFVYEKNNSVIYCFDNAWQPTATDCDRTATKNAFEFSFNALGYSALILASLGFLLYLWCSLMFKREMQDRLNLEEAESSLSRADEAVYGEDSDLELSPLWNATHERLSLYHKIATQQAQDSFKRAQLAMIVGFSIVAISIPLALVRQPPFVIMVGVRG